MQNSPFFSVVIPTYNRADLIGKTLHSILSQDYDRFEIIVVDNSSTDNTAEVIAEINNEKIKYYIKANEERAAARNYGAERAMGDYVTFIDSDDLMLDGALREAAQSIHTYGNIPWFHIAYCLQDGQGQIMSHYHFPKGEDNSAALADGNFLSCIGVFIRKDVIIENKFNEDLKLTTAEDYELWLRIAARHPLRTIHAVRFAIINHSGRSVLNAKPRRLYEKAISLQKFLLMDEKVQEKFGPKIHGIFARQLTYASLHMVLSGSNKNVLGLSFKAFAIDPSILFTKRIFAIVKYYIFNLLKISY